MAQDFVPTSEDKLKAWFDNFAAKIDNYAPNLGLNSQSVLDARANASSASAQITAVDTAKAALKGLVSTKDAAAASVIASVRALASQAKASPAYTEAIGEIMQWVPTGGPFDPSTYKAEIRSADCTAPSEVTIEFRKASGNINGVNVYSRKQGEANFRKLSFRSRSPYVDHTPLTQPNVPEVREYRCRGVINDEEIGEFSDTVPVTVS